MSKQLSFRARALDSTKFMPIYKADEIPELPDFAAINRAVPQMPTGMEKEEETEHHLQRALSAQQVYGTAERLVIPIPEICQVTDQYQELYKIGLTADYKPPKQLIHVQPWGMDQEIPDYDMDSEDELWLTKQSKTFKNLNLTPLNFEKMMDRLEKGSGQTVVTLHEAKALLKEDDDLTIAVYDYWLNKRLRLEHALIPQVKTEKRDGSTTNNPYVAFRRRTEKMQTRKNRKNDETSYEKMLKLRRDLNKALTILELMKRREKSKKELLKLTIEIVEKRYQMSDWDSKALTEALAQRHKLPSLIPLQNQYLSREWGQKDEGFVKKKREYKKRKHKHLSQTAQTLPPSRPQLPRYSEEVLQADAQYSSEEEPLSPVGPAQPLSASEQETEEDPDGMYAFKRKAGCYYHAPIYDGLGSWPWVGQDESGFGDKRFKYSLASLSQPRRCVGFVRRRIGRGGRVILDRAFTEWDEYLSELDLTNSPDENSGWVSEYSGHIKDAKIPHFRAPTPSDDQIPYGGWGGFGSAPLNPAFREAFTPPTEEEFSIQSFQDHREQLLQMQRQQQEQLLKQETDYDHSNSSFSLEHSFSSQPTSRFTVDSASAKFAVSAVCNSMQDLKPKLTLSSTMSGSSGLFSGGFTNPSSVPLHSPALTALMQQPVPLLTSQSAAVHSTISHPSASSTGITLTNGPASSKTCGLSTSPAASILQLNYPLTTTAVTTASSSSASDLATSVSSGSVTPATATTTTSSSSSTSTSAAAAAVLSSSSQTNVTAVSSSSSASAPLPSLSLSSSFSPIAVPSSVLLSSIKTSALSSTKVTGATGTLSINLPPRLAPGKSVPATGTMVTKTLATSAPGVLKLPTSNTRTETMSRENHETVHNLAKDKIVAMEVT